MVIDLRTSERHPASFRDPLGRIIKHDEHVIRGLTLKGFEQYQAVKQTGFLDHLEKRGKIVATREINCLHQDERYAHFLEHEKIPFISYPYEWPFLLLKEAALLHLSIQLEALAQDIVLVDASSYNLQFKGVNPVFIDILSFKKYDLNEPWKAHRQFCEHFLNPLLLQAIKDVPYHPWYKGNSEGISTEMLAKILPWRQRLSFRSQVHVFLPAKYQVASRRKETILSKAKKAETPKKVYQFMLKQLFTWIEQLQPQSSQQTLWEDYNQSCTYEAEEVAVKKAFIAEFSSKVKPKVLWDLGCNDGQYSEVVLQNGAELCVGFDLDLGSLHNAVLRARAKKLNFLPLYQEITDPSPNKGWLLQERDSLLNRQRPNAVIALALIHHLILGHNLPMAEVVNWLVELAPTGVIEFVQKSDPVVSKLLALKGDIFPDYSQENFLNLLKSKANIVKSLTLEKNNRSLYWYEVKA